jgi:hypothetical protein
VLFTGRPVSSTNKNDRLQTFVLTKLEFSSNIQEMSLYCCIYNGTDSDSLLKASITLPLSLFRHLMAT